MATQHSNDCLHEVPLSGSAHPNLLLESFLPGFSVISGLFAGWGIEISSYVTVVLLFAAAGAWVLCSASTFGDMITRHFTSTATIRMDDEAYNFIMAWVAKQPFSQRTRQFVASTKVTSCYVDSDDDSDEESDEEDDFSDTFDVIANDTMTPWTFSEKIKRLMWTPSRGTHFFRYRNHILAFRRIRDEKQTCFEGSRTEEIEISCLGRSGVILKELMMEAQKTHLDKDKKKTVIYRAAVGEDGMYWSRCMSRTPRPLSTVTLDASQKRTFIDDVRLYLHPATRRWYANRGIPYRRGYMFHGRPGTGKTSLAFAAAGFFKLKIYMVNLNSKTLTEEDLAALFQRLPRRCIALLEDIDAAGMTASRRSEFKKVACSNINELGKCVKDELKKAKEDEKAGISLSGILNVIDGVASQEGRILIMTTNHLEHLDSALIRPGRVDFSLGFGNADSAMVQEIFFRIYSKLEDDMPMRRPDEIPNTAKKHCYISSNVIPKKSTRSDPSLSTVSTQSYSRSHDTLYTSEEKLGELAASFSKHIPALKFTPAEIQGYLLLYPQRPRDAVANAEAWVKETMEVEKLEKDRAIEKKRAKERKKRKNEKRDGIEAEGFIEGIKGGQESIEEGGLGGWENAKCDEKEE